MGINRLSGCSAFDWSTDNRGYELNGYYVSGPDGTLIETHRTLALAQSYARLAVEFYGKHGVQSPLRRVWRFVPGIGFVFQSEH